MRIQISLALITSILFLSLGMGCGGGDEGADSSTPDGAVGFDAGASEPCVTAGSSESVRCGQCGTVDRFCSSGRVWVYGTCDDQSGVCIPGATDEIECGNCGSQPARCTASCDWETTGACEAEGLCAPGSQTRNDEGCEEGQNRDVLCTDTCAYEPAGVCESDECDSPGTIEESACGMCGTTERFCSTVGTWEYGVCQGTGVCVPGTSMATNCGMCGQETTRCNESCEWVSAGSCMNEGVCDPGRRQQTADGCSGGQMRVVECSDGCDFVEVEGCSSASVGCTKLDVLLVIDDSGSMAEEQQSIATNVPALVTQLNMLRDGAGAPIDYRIGVTTTGRDYTLTTSFIGLPLPSMVENAMGPGGALLESGGCGMSRPWLERGDSDVVGSLACLVDVGTVGASLEMPLYAIELALTDRLSDGSNAGFVRADALLAVIVVTDEEDCSRPEDDIVFIVNLLPGQMESGVCEGPTMIPARQVVGVLDRIKGRARWTAVLIAGPGPGACESVTLGSSEDAARLRGLRNAATANVTFSSICVNDLNTPLTSAIDAIDIACQDYR